MRTVTTEPGLILKTENPPGQIFWLRHREGNWAELVCTLHSGVTHQIRAHLYYLGLGIIGDPLYQPPEFKLTAKPKVDRMMLHATELTFTHPKTGAIMHFTA